MANLGANLWGFEEGKPSHSVPVVFTTPLAAKAAATAGDTRESKSSPGTGSAIPSGTETTDAPKAVALLEQAGFNVKTLSEQIISPADLPPRLPRSS